MGIYHTFEEIKPACQRVYSDDYKHHENCIPTGQDVSVRVGQVLFVFRANRFHIDRVDAYLENTYHVMTHIFRTSAFLDDYKTMWHMDSEKIRSAVSDAARTLRARHKDAEIKRERAEKQRVRAAKRAEKDFKKKWDL